MSHEQRRGSRSSDRDFLTQFRGSSRVHPVGSRNRQPQRSCADQVRRSLNDLRLLRTSHFWLAIVAEFLGMYFFVLFGTGSVLSKGWQAIYPIDLVRIGLTFGLGITLMVVTFGHISGGHFNPAVSLAMMSVGEIGLCRFLFYTSSQVLGSLLASYTLKWTVPSAAEGNLGANSLGHGMGVGEGCILEGLLTFVLLLVISASTDTKQNFGFMGPLFIGLTVAWAHFFAIPYTGASMNPARSFGPAMVVDEYKNHWIYWVGPLIGGPLGAVAYRIICSLKVKAAPANDILIVGDQENSGPIDNCQGADVRSEATSSV